MDPHKKGIKRMYLKFLKLKPSDSHFERNISRNSSVITTKINISRNSVEGNLLSNLSQRLLNHL